MSKDYKNAGQRKGTAKKPQKTISPFAWLAVGLVAGLFIAFVVYLENKKPVTKASSQSAKPTVTAPSKLPETKSPAKEEKPRFEFYQILPNMEVVIPPEELQADNESGAKQEQRAYMLQAGSFRSFSDADRLKASIALLGMTSKIEDVKSQSGEQWFRVRLGPYDNTRELNRVRRRLNENNIEVLVVRAK